MNNERIEIMPDFLKAQGFSPSFPQRFWRKVSINDNGCWDWTGGKDTCGYGALTRGPKINPKKIGAHRASWILNFGAIQEGLEVCHECNRRQCVNPLHLFLGTHRENMQDCMKKGLFVVNAGIPFPRGEKHPDCKLTDAQIIEILHIGKSQQYKITAQQFGVSACFVSQIMNGQRRGTVKGRVATNVTTPP